MNGKLVYPFGLDIHAPCGCGGGDFVIPVFRAVQDNPPPSQSGGGLGHDEQPFHAGQADHLVGRVGRVGQRPHQVEYGGEAQHLPVGYHVAHGGVMVGGEQEGEPMLVKHLPGFCRVRRQRNVQGFQDIGRAECAAHGPVAVFHHRDIHGGQGQGHRGGDVHAVFAVPAGSAGVHRHSVTPVKPDLVMVQRISRAGNLIGSFASHPHGGEDGAHFCSLEIPPHHGIECLAGIPVAHGFVARQPVQVQLFAGLLGRIVIFTKLQEVADNGVPLFAEDGLGMELDTEQLLVYVFNGHHFPVTVRGGDDGGGFGFCVHRQRMVADGAEGAADAVKQYRVRFEPDDVGFPMLNGVGGTDGIPQVCADGLHSQAYAEDRDTAGLFPDNFRGHARVFRPGWTG